MHHTSNIVLRISVYTLVKLRVLFTGRLLTQLPLFVGLLFNR